jgi:plastocyanin
VVRVGGVLLLSGLLSIALSAIPTIATAQAGTTPAAMVEGNPTDINSWSFAARVPVGGTITWSNQGTQAHSATAVDGSFDSGLITPGASGTIEFDTPGIYAYQCSPHPWMKGTIVVSDDAPSASSMSMVEGSSDINSWGFAVSVSAGQSVKWNNLGAQGHSVTATDGSFDSGIVAPGGSAQLEFDTPGVYAYQCAPHPWMKGNVAVN